MVDRAITGSHRDVCFRNGLLVASPSCGINVSLNRDDDIEATCTRAGSAREFVRQEDIGIHEELPTRTNVISLDQIETMQTRMLLDKDQIVESKMLYPSRMSHSTFRDITGCMHSVKSKASTNSSTESRMAHSTFRDINKDIMDHPTSSNIAGHTPSARNAAPYQQ